jgi:hypothetical protein
VPFNGDVSNPQGQLSGDDIDMLVLFRNFFAFLVGQALVATPQHPSLFSVFMEISSLLSRFEFSNLDGSTFGETATSSFSNYCDELQLSDVRKSREKTIEAIILGERMRFVPLYNESFVHGVGRLGDIKRLNSPKYRLISPVTQKRLERASIDLENRLQTVRAKLDEFYFPSLFAGIANSTTANESKTIRFKSWKASFLAFRKNTISHYRARYGSWPPKARSKKNQFEESGLNRLVLNELYRDFTDLYDMLVDRTSLTTRSADMPADDTGAADPQESTARALRRVMSEYDRSTPPVQPPIPFDTPLLPNLASIRRKKMDAKKEAKERVKRLKDSEISEVLVGCYNHESMKATPFLEDFMRFERRSAHGKSIEEMADFRCGQWLFMYSVLQSLPMLVVDAPGVRFNQGVEYFLCVPPRSGSPWSRDEAKTGRSWFGVVGGQGVVNLPSDIVANGVEGVYRRSHCWQVALQWAEKSQIFSTAMMMEDNTNSSLSSMPPPPLSSVGSSSDPQPTPLLTPGGMTPPMISLPYGRTSSPGANSAMRHNHRASIHVGLEALPLPAGVMPMDPPNRPLSHNPHMSFDDILGPMRKKPAKK